LRELIWIRLKMRRTWAGTEPSLWTPWASPGHCESPLPPVVIKVN